MYPSIHLGPPKVPLGKPRVIPGAPLGSPRVQGSSGVCPGCFTIPPNRTVTMSHYCGALGGTRQVLGRPLCPGVAPCPWGVLPVSWGGTPHVRGEGPPMSRGASEGILDAPGLGASRSVLEGFPGPGGVPRDTGGGGLVIPIPRGAPRCVPK